MALAMAVVKFLGTRRNLVTEDSIELLTESGEEIMY